MGLAWALRAAAGSGDVKAPESFVSNLKYFCVTFSIHKYTSSNPKKGPEVFLHEEFNPVRHFIKYAYLLSCQELNQTINSTLMSVKLHQHMQLIQHKDWKQREKLVWLYPKQTKPPTSPSDAHLACCIMFVWSGISLFIWLSARKQEGYFPKCQTIPLKAFSLHQDLVGEVWSRIGKERTCLRLT